MASLIDIAEVRKIYVNSNTHPTLMVYKKNIELRCRPCSSADVCYADLMVFIRVWFDSIDSMVTDFEHCSQIMNYSLEEET